MLFEAELLNFYFLCVWCMWTWLRRYLQIALEQKYKYLCIKKTFWVKVKSIFNSYTSVKVIKSKLKCTSEVQLQENTQNVSGTPYCTVLYLPPFLIFLDSSSIWHTPNVCTAQGAAFNITAQGYCDKEKASQFFSVLFGATVLFFSNAFHLSRLRCELHRISEHSNRLELPTKSLVLIV